MNEPGYEEQAMTLSTGDIAVLYSDGVTEARDDSGDFFDDKRLVNHLARMHNLPAATVGRRLLSYVDVFVGDAPQTDDLSLIIIRRVGE